jgi:hypothetical protein
MIEPDLTIFLCGETGMSNTREELVDDPWDAFELDEDTAEPEPKPGDFWGELDNDRNDHSR